MKIYVIFFYQISEIFLYTSAGHLSKQNISLKYFFVLREDFSRELNDLVVSAVWVRSKDSTRC